MYGAPCPPVEEFMIDSNTKMDKPRRNLGAHGKKKMMTMTTSAIAANLTPQSWRAHNEAVLANCSLFSLFALKQTKPLADGKGFSKDYSPVVMVVNGTVVVNHALNATDRVRGTYAF